MAANTFTGTVHQTKYLAAQARTVHAIISLKSVVAQGVVTSGKGGKLAVGFVVDGSGSMSGEKWRNARQATADSVAKLPDGTEFFVIIGRSHADTVVPTTTATRETKAAAVSKINGLSDSGGTKFSKWLAEARSQFARTTADIRVLVFLTDGDNDEGGNSLLIQELANCKGRFEVESRGVGDAYKPEQLRLIQQALGGSVDIIREPQDLADDFAAILDRASSLSMSDVYLQLWTPVGATTKMVKQFGTEILDLTAKLQPGSKPQTVRVPTGNWGEEVRDFHIIVELDPASVGKVGDTKLCARAVLTYQENGVEQEIKLAEGGQVVAIWTDDEKQSAVINPKVANYTGQAELAEKIQEGIKALEAGNEEAATKALQRANELAEQTGHEGTQRLIRNVAEVDDKGTLRIKKNVSTMDVRELDTRSQRTARTKRVDG